MRVLIVEDEADIGYILKRFLEEHGGDCKVVGDGIEAVSAFALAHKINYPYDLVCLDIMIPGLDGREVLRRIRETENELGIKGKDRVKVIMATALHDTDSIIGSFHDECEAYLTKPIERDKLKQTLTELELI